MINNILKKINKANEVQKVELEKHEVELSLLDDIKEYSNGYAKYISELDGLKKKGDKLKSELNDVIGAIYKWGGLGSSMADDMVALFNQFEKQAKDLGIDPKTSPDYVNGRKKFVDYAKAEDTAKSIADSYIKIR